MDNILKVHSIETFGTNDGPGVRTVVFLQGCNLKCLYCQNADTISMDGGEQFSIAEITRRVINMRSYFGEDGGITVSGGEPLLQSNVLCNLFRLLKAEGIHTNIDTNGTILTDGARELITNLADLMMFDVKHATREGFDRITGKPLNHRVEESIALREEAGKPFWIRYVLVPGYTDHPDDLRKVGEIYGKHKMIQRLQILPYHKLGAYKWMEMGERYQLAETPENTREQIENAKNILSEYFQNVIV